MKVIDFHCDFLLRAWENAEVTFSLENENVQINAMRLDKSSIALQTFAIFVPPLTHPSAKFSVALDMVDIFYRQVISQPRWKIILNQEDLEELMNLNQHGALLSLEGAEAIQGNLVHLRTLYRLGVRAVGLTWNYQNEAASGALESSGGGLSQFGKELVQEMNRLHMIVDVSHLNERGFWEVVELSKEPVIASHSNCWTIHPHLRNLKDEQLKALFELNGVIGMVFYPPFVSNKEVVKIIDIIRHIEHACELGGENHIGFGSDFDGVDSFVTGLEHPGHFYHLINELLKHYSESQVKKFSYLNWYHLLQRVLPKKN
ncbi:dipeptidase [Microaerobacter geothermalis]|uniref:dipeptidase n=1 Tax=Microaerobacter geothermalis TaxID=674972 RepID=UPI001F32FDA7|nr:dipeptidase [Microaerobacter geothermalis]MCF6093145.1 dipeptidase [Microaerobacter geothermalis]